MSFLADVSAFTSRQRTSLIAEVSQLNVFCTQVGCLVNLSSFQETLRLLSSFSLADVAAKLCLSQAV